MNMLTIMVEEEEFGRDDRHGRGWRKETRKKNDEIVLELNLKTSIMNKSHIMSIQIT